MLTLQAIAQTILQAVVDGLVEMVEVCFQHLTPAVTQRAAAGLDLVVEMLETQALQRHKQAAAELEDQLLPVLQAVLVMAAKEF
jgi:hypothetical protein